MRQKKSTTARSEIGAMTANTPMPSRLEATSATIPGGLVKNSVTTAIYEKIRLALRNMGFRDVQARRAVAAVAGNHDPNEELPLEQVLREAIWVAMAA